MTEDTTHSRGGVRRGSGWLRLAVLLDVAIVALAWALGVLLPSLPTVTFEGLQAWDESRLALGNIPYTVAVAVAGVLVATGLTLREAERRGYPRLRLKAVEAVVLVLVGAVGAGTVFALVVPVF